MPDLDFSTTSTAIFILAVVGTLILKVAIEGMLSMSIHFRLRKDIKKARRLIEDWLHVSYPGQKMTVVVGWGHRRKGGKTELLPIVSISREGFLFMGSMLAGDTRPPEHIARAVETRTLSSTKWMAWVIMRLYPLTKRDVIATYATAYRPGKMPSSHQCVASRARLAKLFPDAETVAP